MSQRYILTFNDVSSYQKCKADVVADGGEIKNDLGPVLLGFTAVIPDDLFHAISNNLVNNGISTFEPDSVVSIPPQPQ